MKIRLIGSIFISCATMSGCADDRGAETYTLYRNSIIASDMRIHVATFDATETDRLYNRNNCEMSVRLRNANVKAFDPNSNQTAGFWCEPGKFAEKGSVPFSFDSEFPTELP